MILWKCPNGCASVRGVTRPRRNDICRWCLACSAKAGVLVEREAPALERRRSVRAERKLARAAKVSAAAEAAKVAYPKGWLRAWAAHLFPLKSWGMDMGAVLHTIKIRQAHPRRQKIDGWIFKAPITDSTGRVWPAGEVIGGIGEPVYRIREPILSTGRAGRHRVVLTAGTDRGDALATMIHEFAHVATAPRSQEHHGDVWRSIFFSAVEELVGVAPELLAGSKHSVHEATVEAIKKSGAIDVADPRTWRKP